MRFIVLTSDQAAHLREQTAGNGWQLDPRDLGDGRFILTPDVLDNPFYATWKDYLQELSQEEIELPEAEV